MTDFAKAKIAFALALVGVLFAMHPLITATGSVGYELFGTTLTVRLFYFVTLALLGCAVYCYALDFLTETTVGFAHKAGNLFYTLALFIPPLAPMLWVASLFAEQAAVLFRSPYATTIANVLVGVLSSIAGAAASRALSRVMNRKDKQSSLDQLATQEGAHLQRAEQMLQSQHHDLAVLESFRAVETALRRALVDSDIGVRFYKIVDMISTAASVGIVPEETVPTLHEIRTARNNAVHGTEPVSAAHAEAILSSTRRVLGTIQVRPGVRKKKQKHSQPEVGPVSSEAAPSATPDEPST